METAAEALINGHLQAVTTLAFPALLVVALYALMLMAIKMCRSAVNEEGHTRNRWEIAADKKIDMDIRRFRDGYDNTAGPRGHLP